MVVVLVGPAPLPMAQSIAFIGGGGGGGVGWACPAADGAEHKRYCGVGPVLPPGDPYGYGLFSPSSYIVMAIAA